jgi:2-oxo-4-hydroxy-4-carboxy--5-ureidoimidazoline (OHCU) decarboxylase
LATTLSPIEALNDAPATELAGLLALLFEEPGPLAARLAAGRPFASWAELLDAAEPLAAALPQPDKVALLRGHPRLGTDPARLTGPSRAEQGPADADADAELARLNDAYEERFGFPFVAFVAGRTRAAMTAELAERLERPPAAELAAGVEAVIAIARDRLAKLTGEPG